MQCKTYNRPSKLSRLNRKTLFIVKKVLFQISCRVDVSTVLMLLMFIVALHDVDDQRLSHELTLVYIGL